MALDKNDLKAIGELMDKKMAKQSEEILVGIERKIEDKMIDFHEKVTAPMIYNTANELKEEIALVDSKIDRIERKLDNVTDMLAVRITDHEKRIVKLERAIA